MEPPYLVQLRKEGFILPPRSSRSPVKTSYIVHLNTGYELGDNDIHRLRERIEESVGHIAREYLADLQVEISHYVPGPQSVTSPKKQEGTS